MEHAGALLVVFYASSVAVAISVGIGIPTFYDWTGADQSRPAAVVGQIAIGLLVATCLGWSGLIVSWWLGRRKSRRADEPFEIVVRSDTPGVEALATQDVGGATSIRQLLALTTAVAIVVVAIRFAPWTCAVVSLISACGWAGWTIYASPQCRLPLMAIFGWMWCPYSWLVTSSPIEIDDLVQVAAFVAGVPALIPSLLLSRFVEGRTFDDFWVGLFCSGVSILLAVWAARRSHRWAMAYLLLTLVLSVFGSFWLHAAMLA